VEEDYNLNLQEENKMNNSSKDGYYSEEKM